MQFTFDPEAHAYALDGQLIPGVTEVLRQVVDLSMIRDDVLDRKRAIGSALHQAIELDAADELDPDSIDPAVAPYFAGWRRFQAEHHAFIVHANERPVFSQSFRYACTPDVWGVMSDSLSHAPFVLEIKSTATLHPAVGLQTAAQLRAIGEWSHEDGRTRDRFIATASRFALQLNNRGGYKLTKLEARDDFSTFLALLTAWRWKRRHSINL